MKASRRKKTITAASPVDEKQRETAATIAEANVERARHVVAKAIAGYRAHDASMVNVIFDMLREAEKDLVSAVGSLRCEIGEEAEIDYDELERVLSRLVRARSNVRETANTLKFIGVSDEGSTEGPSS